jgi:hypothetical protein
MKVETEMSGCFNITQGPLDKLKMSLPSEKDLTGD